MHQNNRPKKYIRTNKRKMKMNILRKLETINMASAIEEAKECNECKDYLNNCEAISSLKSELLDLRDLLLISNVEQLCVAENKDTKILNEAIIIQHDFNSIIKGINKIHCMKNHKKTSSIEWNYLVSFLRKEIHRKTNNSFQFNRFSVAREMNIENFISELSCDCWLISGLQNSRIEIRDSFAGNQFLYDKKIISDSIKKYMSNNDIDIEINVETCKVDLTIRSQYSMSDIINIEVDIVDFI